MQPFFVFPLVFRQKISIFAEKGYFMFDDYRTYPPQRVSPVILWEYDTASPEWDWDVMAPRVAQRVIQYGEVSDYYALLQMYGGLRRTAEIVRRIPSLSDKDLNWACFVFNLRKEDMLCFTRKSLRRERMGF